MNTIIKSNNCYFKLERTDDYSQEAIKNNAPHRMVMVSKKFNPMTGEYAITTIYGNTRKDRHDAAVDLHTLRYNAYEKNYLVDTDGVTTTISTPEEMLTITIEPC
jgi:hypothetical protein